jgi:hypothetical protein
MDRPRLAGETFLSASIWLTMRDCNGETGVRILRAYARTKSPQDSQKRQEKYTYGEHAMTHAIAIYIIFGIIVFVIPAVCILGDNAMWDRKK